MNGVSTQMCQFLTGFHALLVERDEGGADAASKSLGMMIEPGIETTKLVSDIMYMYR